MSYLGWVGKQVRHADGREGAITGEYAGFGHAQLSITIPGQEKVAMVQLNTSGPDSGEAGWEWWCDNFDGGARYISLGDHPKPEQDETPLFKP